MGAEETLVLASLRDASAWMETVCGGRGVASLNRLATGFDGSAISYFEPTQS
jgi:hypothetical protein